MQDTILHTYSNKIISGIIILILVILGSYFYFNQHILENNDYSKDVNIQDNFVLPPQDGEKYLHYRPENKITVINYFSLDCPYCRKLFFEEEKFVQQYGDKVNFAFRDKPLSSNPLSYEKALIKECVYLNNGNSDQKYFEFSKDVFLNYENKSNNLRSNDWVKMIALKYIGQNVLDICLNDEKLKQKILGFRAQADASQVFWTPTIVVFKDGVEVERVEKVWVEIYKRVLEKYTGAYKDN